MTSVCFVVPSWHYWTNPLKLQPMWEMYYATVCQAHFDYSICMLRHHGSYQASSK